MNTQVFAGHLLPKESIVWSGRPGQGLLLTSRDGYLIPFSIFWSGFIVFWMFGASRTPGHFMMLFGIPFVLVGLYMLVGRFLVDAWLRSRMYYALTDRRILILRESPWSRFTTFALSQLPEATLIEKRDGRGTIRFGQQISMFSSYSNRGWSGWTPALDPTPQFLDIPDVRRVFAKVQDRTQPA